MKHVSIITPVYNEEKNIPLLVNTIATVMKDLPYHYNVIMVDDGSSDGSLSVIKEQVTIHPEVKYISFSRNFGHQNALKAGLDMAIGDCVISMDGDMQHPADLIPVMLAKYEEGYDVVYTIRQEDKNLPAFKKSSSNFYYKILNRLSDVKVDKGAADFRLMSMKVTEAVRNLPEQDLFFRGIVKWVGFKQIALEYNPQERVHGSTKYTIRKMVSLALNGILSFSKKPLYLAAYLGIIFSTLSLLYIPYIAYSYFYGHPISGWASVIATITFFGGLQLLILGVIGIYIGRMFIQMKNRPMYIVKESNLT
jgi:polyisoprenyl-phosphate glycosyltransferase